MQLFQYHQNSVSVVLLLSHNVQNLLIDTEN
nr:MAG TPA: hypothetical protein [Caudoviricetes sp.]